MPRGAAGSRTSFRHHPVQHAKALFVARFLDHLALSGADRVPDPHRLLRRVESFELVFVVHEDFLEAARVEPTNGARPAVSDRREVPTVPEMAAEFRLPALRLSPLVSELPVAEPLLAAEPGPRCVLRGSHREKPLQVRFELGLRARLVYLLFSLLFLFLLALLLFRRLRFLLRFLFGLLFRLRRRGFLFFGRGLLGRLLLDERVKPLSEVVDLSFLTQAVAFGPAEEFGLLRGANLRRRGERLLRLGYLGNGGLLRLLRGLGGHLRLLLFRHPPASPAFFVLESPACKIRC